MNKIKFLSIISVVLFASNLLLVGYIFFRKPPRSEGPRKEIIKRLHLDEAQQKSYADLIKVHGKGITEAQDSILVVKQQLYATMINPSKAAQKDSLVQVLGNLQMRIENTHYQHFMDLKKLCKPEQQSDFEAFSKEIITLFPQQKRKSKE